MKAYIYPGQGSQYPGMGKELFDTNPQAQQYFERANELLGFRITDIMFSGSADDLRQTKVTQPAIFLHSAVLTLTMGNGSKPSMVAGHSLGEFSALVANKTLSFEDGLELVKKRALAMQKACEKAPSTMAAVIGLDNEIVEQVCANIDEIVVPANYNCPGQLVISGSVKGIEVACEKLKEAGARRALPLKVGGGFHSPLMEPAAHELAGAIQQTKFNKPVCPIYQNVTASPVNDPETIKQNLIAQLTSPVRWFQSIEAMIEDGATKFTEVGPGKVLQGLMKKISRQVETAGI